MRCDSEQFTLSDIGAKMSNRVTLTLPDDLYENAQQWSVMTQRNLSETLIDPPHKSERLVPTREI